MKQGLILLLGLLGDIYALAQTETIRGVIKDADTRQVLESCNIRLANNGVGTVSDSNGQFRIRIPNNITQQQLVISSIGYRTDTIEIQSGMNEYQIYLTASRKTLGDVVVTGVSRATAIRENPVSIVVISSQSIERSSESNIIDVLVKNTPGLNAVKTGPNISKPFIRGLGYNRVLTLYDGVRQEGQQWGDEHGIEVDSYGIEKAEVIKGPSSLMYGSDALAGVVSLFPVLPHEKDGVIRGKFLSEFQSNNGLIGNGFSIRYRDTHWLWASRGSYRLARNYVDKIDGRVYNTGFDEKNASGLVGYSIKNGYSNLNLTLYDNLQGIPDGSRDSLTRKFTKQIAEGAADNIKDRPIVPEAELNSYKLSPLHQHIQHYRVYANNHYQLAKGDFHALFGFQQNIRREFDHPTEPGQAGLYVRLNTINYGLRYNVPEFAGFEISAGVNGMFQGNKTKNATDFPIPDYNLFDAGAYGYAQWKYKKLTMSGGMRYDVRSLSIKNFYVRKNPITGFSQHVLLSDTTGATLQFRALEKKFEGVSFGIGGTYPLTGKISVKANIARGYRSPSITEIASNGLDPGAHIVYLGNRTFVPEFSFQEDLGVMGNFKAVDATLSVFNNAIQHYIYLSELVDAAGNPVMLTQGNKTYQYQQASAQLYGMEATLSMHPAEIPGLRINSNLAMVYGFNTKKEFENKGIYGQYLPFIPPVRLLSSIYQEIKTKSKTFPLVNFTAEIDFNAPQNRFLALYHTETQTPGYTLVNAAIRTIVNYSKKSVMEVQLQVNNLFDNVYQSNLSRLKYFEYYIQSPNGHSGMYGMGRNICAKVIFNF